MGLLDGLAGLLNEPYQAVSICLDILHVVPEHQQALIMLLLAYTDQFKDHIYPAFDNAMQVLERLGDTHCRRYYLGIINERRAKAHLDRGGPGSAEMAHDWYLKAMDAYEQALELEPDMIVIMMTGYEGCCVIKQLPMTEI